MRPIPVDVTPSRVYLSQKDQVALFGSGYAMTIMQNLPQVGQYVCAESLHVYGRLKRGLHLHVLGPHWERSFVEISHIDGAYLGYEMKSSIPGDMSQAKPCSLVGPEGQVELSDGLVYPKPSVFCSPKDAEQLGLSQGALVTLQFLGQTPVILKDVIVRIHPTYQLRAEIRPDQARELWITKTTHARIV